MALTPSTMLPLGTLAPDFSLPDPAGSGVKAFLELFYKDGRCQDYVERMRAYPEIRQCCGISGETDMLVQVEAASMARLAEVRGAVTEVGRFVVLASQHISPAHPFRCSL